MAPIIPETTRSTLEPKISSSVRTSAPTNNSYDRIDLAIANRMRVGTRDNISIGNKMPKRENGSSFGIGSKTMLDGTGRNLVMVALVAFRRLVGRICFRRHGSYSAPSRCRTTLIVFMRIDKSSQKLQFWT
jgi:hypothetical protein